MTPERMDQVGHYVLGLLEGEERKAFEAEMARDPELAAAMRRLDAQFQRLDDTVVPQAPSEGLWGLIEGALGTPAEPETTRMLSFKPRGDRRWAPYAMAASILLALGVGYIAGDMIDAGAQPVMIAVLLNESDATPGAIIEAFADDSVRVVPLEAFNVPEGRILEVWTLPDPKTGPVSLGTFADPANIRLVGPELPTPQVGQLYEITMEPAQGSPTGRPTGPILAKGYAKAPV